MAAITVKQKGTGDIVNFDLLLGLVVQQSLSATSKRSGVKECC